MRTHESVSILIFNTTSHCFVLVKQFRPAVYVYEWEKTKPKQSEEEKTTEGEGGEEKEKQEEEGGEKGSEEGEGEKGGASDVPPASAGVTYELCSGRVESPDLPLEEVARKGVLQECGYDVPVEKLRRIASYRSGVGLTGAKQTLFYAEVSEENHVGASEAEGEVEPRGAEVVKVPLHEAMTFAYDESIPKTLPVIYSFTWFHGNMSPKYKISTNV